jgi:UDP-N-acetylmuramoylalanine--D-glutamate ligase
MQESFFKGKRVTVFGLGINMGGVGTVRFLAEHGAREIIVTDIKGHDELASSIQQLAKYRTITYVLGQHRPEDFTRTDMVIKNPGIPWTNEYVKLAEKAGVPIEMDSSLFFRFSKAPIIGVTGTKGKTTTASLVAHILESAGRKTVAVGIGQTGVLSMLPKATSDSTVVFELSSWRLSALGHMKRSPHIAIITNLYPDHLNYYRTLPAYVDDKKQIFRYQHQHDVLVANYDNEMVRDAVQDAPSEVIWFSKEGSIDGDGVWKEGSVLCVRRGGRQDVLLPLEKVPLPGEHNVDNVLAATAASLAAGLSIEQIRRGIESFKGVSHRLAFVAEKRGVKYYDDTAATIPEAAIAALRSFDHQPILIAGGSDKKLEFGAFAEEIIERSKALVLFRGEGTEKLIHELRKRLPEYHSFTVVESMGKAVELASRFAESGDSVLLSPGAASFGLFKNEFDRGEQFVAAVKRL